MDGSPGNFSSFATSANSTTSKFQVLNILDIFVYTMHFLLGLPAHSYVLWIIYKKRSGIESEFFSLNLSVCEIMYCLDSLFMVVPSSKVDLLIWFLLGLGVTGRPLFQCLICLERYLAVVHPVTFLKYKPLRYRVICCAIAWTFTLVSCFLSMFRFAMLNFFFYTWYCSAQFFLYIFIMLFCCLAVLRALKQSGPGDKKKEEENQMKTRAFHLILITTVCMSFIYVPFTVAGFSFILTRQYYSELFSAVFFCFVLVSFVPPILHLHRNGKLSCPGSP